MLVLAPAQQLHIQDKLEAFSTYDLEIGVKELSLSDSNTRALVDEGILDLITLALTQGDDVVQAMILDDTDNLV